MKQQEKYFKHHSQPLSSSQRFNAQLALKIGLKEAIILQQIHDWLTANQNSMVKNGKYWIYNTYEQWKRQFPFWSKRTIQRTILNLERMRFLETHLSGGYRTIKYYTINYEVLQDLGIELFENKSLKRHA